MYKGCEDAYSELNGPKDCSYHQHKRADPSLLAYNDLGRAQFIEQPGYLKHADISLTNKGWTALMTKLKVVPLIEQVFVKGDDTFEVSCTKLPLQKKVC